MKSIFKLLVVLVICLAGVGLYRGWFSFSSSSNTEKNNINVSVDKEKMKQDVTKAKERVGEKVKGIAEEVKEREGK